VDTDLEYRGPRMHFSVSFSLVRLLLQDTVGGSSNAINYKKLLEGEIFFLIVQVGSSVSILSVQTAV